MTELVTTELVTTELVTTELVTTGPEVGARTTGRRVYKLVNSRNSLIYSSLCFLSFHYLFYKVQFSLILRFLPFYYKDSGLSRL